MTAPQADRRLSRRARQNGTPTSLDVSRSVKQVTRDFVELRANISRMAERLGVEPATEEEIDTALEAARAKYSTRRGNLDVS